MPVKFFVAGALVALGLAGPAVAGAETPPAPDYASPNAWVALPGRPGNAEEAPAGIATGAAADRDRVNVFFIHPTTYLVRFIGNARFDEPGATEMRIENGVLRFQVSVFNACCRIFVPHYRQASLAAITRSEPAALAATELAYGDVRRAFDDFIEHRNQGRPFILASHSQGSIHAMRLLQERIIGQKLAGRMVAAYVIGASLPTAIAERGLPVCAGATSTGCVVDWNTVRQGHEDERRKERAIVWWDGRYQPIAGLPVVCVNPLSWSPGGAAPASANLGGVYNAGRGAPLPAPVPQVTGATCEKDLLGVDIPWRERRHFSDVLTLFGVYHDFDYSLFYMNIRANAEARVTRFLASVPR
jgi:Protein of unknown function (DUF3089)